MTFPHMTYSRYGVGAFHTLFFPSCLIINLVWRSAFEQRPTKQVVKCVIYRVLISHSYRQIKTGIRNSYPRLLVRLRQFEFIYLYFMRFKFLLQNICLFFLPFCLISSYSNIFCFFSSQHLKNSQMSRILSKINSEMRKQYLHKKVFQNVVIVTVMCENIVKTRILCGLQGACISRS